eukprot:CAMPEP_0113486988 /NCGR_PEP_ID=MMETSP0014_2-20120614/25280_1 /TAXON_ID=2857 /ORGANISM="Nitzschia sp." /LENGTH=539 /DNA_ID=CAMNT_0000380677 /DNA_START=302 /DNA_END=1921 /DNA_ORIENTATION=+ /assembly_acc=CAM_ASM_000159
MTRRNSGCHQHRRLVLLTATLMMAGVVLSWITTATEIQCVAAFPGAQQQQRRRRQVRVRRQHRQYQRNLKEEEQEELPQADDPEEIDVEQDKEQQDNKDNVEQQDKEQDKNNVEQDEEPQDMEQNKEEDKNNAEPDEEQDKNNVEPDNVVTTEQPQATPTAAPVAPTPAPMQQPQDTPTSDPLPAPTTQQPTSSPSARPTNSPTTSSSSSGQVVTTTTLSPTDPPTPAPTTASPSEPEVIGIPLPKITIDVVVPDEGSSASALPSETADSMEVTFLLFLDKVLQDSSDPYNFDYSHIEASVAVSTTLDDDEETRRHLMMTTTTIRRRRRRRMAEGYRIEMDGTAYFGSDSPTSESLEQSLVVYFSFWGTSVVDEYLQESGLTNADVSAVVVGDQNIVVAMGPDVEEILAGDADNQNANSQSNVTSGGEDGSENSDGSESSEEEEEDDDGINWIMVIVGLTPAVLAPFVLFACVKYHLRQKRRKAEKKENKLSMKESQSEQHDTSKGDVSMEKEDEERPEIDIQDAETDPRRCQEPPVTN